MTNSINIMGKAAEVIGYITVISAFLTAIIKPLRNRFTNWLRKKSNTDDLEKKIDSLSVLLKEHIKKDEVKTEMLDRLSKTQLCMMRDAITETYYKYIDQKQLPLHIREKLIKEYEDYHSNNGNTYIDVIYPEMLEWEVID